MHDTAYDEAARGTASNMQRHSLFHTQMFYQPPLGEEVCGKLYRAAETCADHGWPYTSVQTLDALGAVYLSHTVDGVFVFMLCADGQEG